MDVQLASLLLTFCSVYLKLAHCWTFLILVPVFCLSFFFFFFFFFSFASLADIILNPSAWRELDWSGANFTLYSIYANFVFCCSFYFSLFIFCPLLFLYLNFFLAPQKHVPSHTHTDTYTQTSCLCISHIRLLNRWGTTYHTGRQITFHTVDTLMSCFGHTCRGAALLYLRPPIPVHLMSQPPVVCILMNVLSFNSSPKTVIPNMPLAAPTLSFIPSPSFIRP